jgi:hypothetical protein
MQKGPSMMDDGHRDKRGARLVGFDRVLEDGSWLRVKRMASATVTRLREDKETALASLFGELY